MKWLAWSEFCYNTSYHTAIKMFPFQALYGVKPPSLLTCVEGTTRSREVVYILTNRDSLIKLLKQNLSIAQSRMKFQAA